MSSDDESDSEYYDPDAEEKIEERLHSLREGYNDQRMIDSIFHTETVTVIDETHADVDEWVLLMDDDQPILRLDHAVWKVEKGDGEWDDWSWEPDGDLFAVDMTKEAIPWDIFEKETGHTSDIIVDILADKFSDRFMDLFYKGEEGIPDPTVVVDPLLRKELEKYSD
jgi:hypothetical protein